MLNASTVLLAASLAIFAAGCGGTQYDYSDANDTKPGPGLLSGEDGVFNILRPQPSTAERSAKQGAKQTCQ